MSQTATAHGTLLYASPQMRKMAASEQESYRPGKGDVYSFGVTLLEMASLIPPNDLLTLTNLDRIISSKINALVYSERFKRALRRMLDINEETRAEMEEVLQEFEASKRLPQPYRK